jgi:hypothetical protein
VRLGAERGEVELGQCREGKSRKCKGQDFSHG